MRSNYKTIGQFIRVVDVRNKEDKKDNLLGVSVSKVFIKSIANTVGTDFTLYRVVKKNQFTYIPDTSRRGDKIGLALLDSVEEGLVSQAYTVFEITDKKSLLPEYLMMWFCRPEFDRYARYISHGSVREIFSWEDMCNVSLPIPHITKQKEIVKEYQVIQDRIAHNQQLIQKLEETAQAIYKQWFVDFEFPDEEGKPYKSNGGEMVESELGEIPKGWKIGSLGDLIELQRGFDLATQYRKEGIYPIYGSTGIAEYHMDYKVKGPGIVTGRSGSLGEVFYIEENFWPLNTTLWIKTFKNATPIFSFFVLKGINISDYNGGSAVPTLNRNHIHLHQLIVPEIEVIKRFEKIEKKLFHQIKVIDHQQKALQSVGEILLSKIATIDN